MSDLVLARRYTNDRCYEAFDNLDVSEATRATYIAGLTPFINFIETNQFNLNTFLEFKRELRTRDDIATSTKNKYLVSARIFLKELHRQGVMPTDITHNVRNFKLDKRHKVNGLNNDEVFRLQNWCHIHSDDFRNVALMCLLFYNGLRQFEVCNLDWEDVRFKSHYIFVKGKSRDDKEPVFLHPQTERALKTYYNQLHFGLWENTRPRGAIFRSNSIPSKRGRMTTRGLRHIVKQVFKEVYIDKPVHGIRHTFVTRLVKEFNGDITRIARFSRHKSLEMVQIYNDAEILLEDVNTYVKAFDDVELSVV